MAGALLSTFADLQLMRAADRDPLESQEQSCTNSRSDSVPE